MYLNPFGQIVAEEWKRTEELRPRVSLDAYVVMPDHFHGIICVNEEEGHQSARHGASSREARLATTRATMPGLQTPTSGSLSTIVGAFKSAATRRINLRRQTPGARVWQSSFWDTFIRSDADLQKIRRYIQRNPRRWSSTG